MSLELVSRIRNGQGVALRRLCPWKAICWSGRCLKMLDCMVWSQLPEALRPESAFESEARRMA